MEVVAVDPAGLEAVGTVVAVIPGGFVVPIHTMMMARTIIKQLDWCVGGVRDGTSRSTEIILGINHLKRNSKSLYFLLVQWSLCTVSVEFILS